jgi:hypothetical protein
MDMAHTLSGRNWSAELDSLLKPQANFPLGKSVPASSALARDVNRVKSLATWLDARFTLLGIRFGFESLIGFVPAVGDTLTALIGLYPILIAHRHKLGRSVQVRMGLNLLIEWLVGLVPFIGDLFDTAFKANVRNARLLERAAFGRDGVSRG